MTKPPHKNEKGQPTDNGGHFAAKQFEADENLTLDTPPAPVPEPMVLPQDDWRTGGTSSLDDFEAKFEAVDSPLNESMWQEGELDRVPENHLWTVVDGDDGGAVVMAGRHFVNRIGYVVTVQPWESTFENYTWWEARDEDSDPEGKI